MKLKHIAAAVAGLAVAGSAMAADYDLGMASVDVPLSFGGLTAVGPFTDTFSFELPPNLGSGYTVSNFTLLGGMYNTVLASLSLVSNEDGILFNADDMLLASSVVPSGETISLAFGPTMAGSYYLSVMGIGNGTEGGIYTGAISVTAIPEPETYAMMFAGLAVVGFLAARRRV